jgi:hypothetical protein
MKTIIHMDAVSQELWSFILPHPNGEVYSNPSGMPTFTCWSNSSKNLIKDFILLKKDPHYLNGENIKRHHIKNNVVSFGISFLNTSKFIN